MYHTPSPSACSPLSPRLGSLVALALVSVMAAGPVRAFGHRPAAGDRDPHAQTEVCSPGWLRRVTAGPRAAIAAVGDTVPVQRDAAIGPRPDRGPAAVSQTDPMVRNPSDPYFPYQRNSLMLMGALDAWDTSRGGPDVTVAVVSTGVRYDHPDLVAKIWRNPDELPGNGLDDDSNGYIDDVSGWNFPGRNNDPHDIGPKGRGTLMAGIVGASTNNGEGVAGTSWGARIMPLKTLVLTEDQSGQPVVVGTVQDVVEAVCYAANNGAGVIAMGGFINDPESAQEGVQQLEQAIRYAKDVAGAVVVAGAGDCGTAERYCPPPEYGPNPPILPAAFDRWVVAAQSFGLEKKQRAEASSGYWVDVSAPGEGFWTTIDDGDLPYVPVKPQKATSDFAAAHVAGVVAVMRSVNPNYDPDQLEDVLCRSADRPRGVPFGPEAGPIHNDQLGCGYVNFDRTLDNLPPVVRVEPAHVQHFTDGATPWPVLEFENPYLRASRWIVTPQDGLWLLPRPVRDDLDGVSRAAVAVDLDRLGEQLGGTPQAGDPPATSSLEACPLDDRPGWGTCQQLTYRLQFVDVVRHAFLPAVGRRWSARGDGSPGASTGGLSR